MVQFANGVGGTGGDQGRSITVDSGGNSYVTGRFQGTVDFDPRAGTANLASAGNDDVFIAKYDSSGDLLWAKNVGGTSIDRGESIQVDSSGNSYVTGYFSGTADFDPGAGTANLTSAGFDAVFIAKYDSSGDLLWAKNVGGTSIDTGQSIAIDSSGNSYVTGDFGGTADFDPGAGTANLTSAGGQDVFIARYDASGDLLWAKNVGGTNADLGHSITVDSSGNSYVTGRFQGTADFDPGAGTANLTSAGSEDVFIAKYDSSGDLAWAKNVGGTNTDRGHSIQVDSSGNSYVTGYFNGTADFDPGAGTANLTSAGSSDVFIAKYDNGGDLLWAKNVGGTLSDYGRSIQVDSSGNSYVTGSFSGTADFDPGAGTVNLTAAGLEDVFIAKYGSNGDLVWAKSVGGASEDVGESIKVDSSGNSYVTGYFRDIADFDPGSGTENLTSAGSTDVFLLKLDSDGNFVSVSSETPDSGSGLTVTNRSSEDLAGSATGRTLVNNSGEAASGTLIENTGNGNVVTVVLPDNMSLTISGPASAEVSSLARSTLAGQIQDSGADPASKSLLDGHGQSFFDHYTDAMSVDVRSISFATTETGAQTVQFIGSTGESIYTEAFVIDTSGLPSGSTLQLDNIEFAAIVGNASVTGGAGQNYVVGDDAVQFISLGAEDDTLAGGGGNDTVGSSWGEDVVYGNQGQDSLFGGGGMDTLYGGQDADTVRGDNDADVLYGNKGGDTLSGGENEDTLFGGRNSDIVYGNQGADLVAGNTGNDQLYGGQDNDSLSGGAGDDLLAGNKGDDTLNGGDGADTFVYDFGGGDDVVTDYEVGADALSFTDGLSYTATESGGSTVLTLSDGGTLILIGVQQSQLAAASGWEF
ncbi:SBBP repeat-containing protein [Nisaea sp.]|uniref:SBBP repeat-containing protein n=1 Tax=Nisaea sp. TaxID=2024842 RepID=UPI002B269851|nr:SBBP repeat-containing protein [Nisaea sp.]